MPIFPSKYPGICEKCNQHYAVGDKIFWKKGMKAGEHALCSDEGKKIKLGIDESRAKFVEVSNTIIPAPPGLRYMPYQIAGINYMLSREGTLLGDEMGLGKTIQCIGVINSDPTIKKVIIVCPLTLKINWEIELKKWLVRDMSISVIGSDFKDGDILIINYNGIEKHMKSIQELKFDLFIVDEAHLIKNPETKRCKNVQKIGKISRKKIAATGSPIPNRVRELWTTLQLVNPDKWDPAGKVKLKGQFVYVEKGNGAGWWKFAKKYCGAYRGQYGWDFGGSSNVEELGQELRLSCMLRRLKSEVLTDLPAKRRQLIEIFDDSIDYDDDISNLNNKLDVAEAELELANASDDTNEYKSAVSKLDKMFSSINFEDMAAARLRVGLKKIPHAIDHIRTTLESVDKLIVFAHHHAVIDAISKDLEKDIQHVVITGKTKIDERQAAVEKFQNDPNCKVFIGSITATGVGLTLTAASNVLFVELDYVPAWVTQAEDRAHRIGQQNNVLVQHLILSRTLDARIAKIIVQKQNLADSILDVTSENLDTIKRDDLKKNSTTTHVQNLINDDEVIKIHEKLKYLASCCDGAREVDGTGFNKFDSTVGKSLASMQKLTQKQALLGQRIVHKYRKQLGNI